MWEPKGVFNHNTIEIKNLLDLVMIILTNVQILLVILYKGLNFLIESSILNKKILGIDQFSIIILKKLYAQEK